MTLYALDGLPDLKNPNLFWRVTTHQTRDVLWTCTQLQVQIVERVKFKTVHDRRWPLKPIEKLEERDEVHISVRIENEKLHDEVVYDADDNPVGVRPTIRKTPVAPEEVTKALILEYAKIALETYHCKNASLALLGDYPPKVLA